MRNMIFENLDREDIKLLIGRNRLPKEFYGGFFLTDTQMNALIPTVFPFPYKIDSKAKALAEENSEEYTGVRLKVKDYFFTRVGNLIYGQLRTAPIVDGVDPHTARYMTGKEAKYVVDKYNLDVIRTHKEFEEAQSAESVEVE